MACEDDGDDAVLVDVARFMNTLWSFDLRISDDNTG